MLILNDKLIFIRVPKTGSTYLQNLLTTSKLVTESLKFHGQSHVPMDLPAKMAVPAKNLPSFCVVRNPLAWYFSYYHHMIRIQGGHYDYIESLKARYLDKSIFHVWLHEWLLRGIPKSFKDTGRLWRMEEQRKDKFLGPYSYLHNFLTCHNLPKTLKEYEKDYLVTHTCRLESLQEDVTGVLNKYGMSADWHSSDIIKRNARKNQKPLDYLEWYTPDLVHLVQEKDSILCEKYYSDFPSPIYMSRKKWGWKF